MQHTNQQESSRLRNRVIFTRICAEWHYDRVHHIEVVFQVMGASKSNCQRMGFSWFFVIPASFWPESRPAARRDTAPMIVLRLVSG